MIGLSILACAATASAQAPDRSALSAKQEIVGDRVEQLQDQMYRLIELLEEQEPELISRLKRTLDHMGREAIREDIDQLVALLADESRLAEAADSQGVLLADLDQLLELLMTEDDGREEMEKRIEQLEEALADIKALIEKENKLQDRTDQAAGAAPDPEAAKVIAALIEGQKALMAQTAAAADGQGSAEDLAEAQKALAEQTAQAMKTLKEGDEAAAEAMSSAEQAMGDAAEDMADGQPGAAGDAQADALSDLEAAQDSLKPRPPEGGENLPELDQAQQDVKSETDTLSEEMKGDASRSGSEPVPGQPDVERAASHMGGASQQLQSGDPGKASAEQGEAVADLQKAAAQVEQELQQLKKELQEKRLEELRVLFQEMRVKQVAINNATVELAAVDAQAWERAHTLEALRQGDAERALGTIAEKAVVMIGLDGTTTVLPYIVKDLRVQMSTVAQRLENSDVGEATQWFEAEIVALLDDILAVIDAAQNPGEPAEASPPSQQGQPGQEPPLLPDSAELRLLKRVQQRVHQRTRAYHRSDTDDQAMLERLAEQQHDVAETAAEMYKRVTGRSR
jgi:hypothetical protein